jgi:CRP-like cAMP-binding protein
MFFLITLSNINVVNARGTLCLRIGRAVSSPLSTASLAHATIRNQLLAALRRDDFDRLASDLERVSTEFGETLEEPGREIDHVYFPEPGVASVIAISASGKRVEVGVIGPEGMSGLSLVHGVESAAHHVFVQIPFRALRIKADPFRRALDESRSIHAVFLRFAQAFLIQVSQTALCNGHFTIEERLARWLLMCHDRADREDLPLTHEFLSMMLGVRRAGITTSLRILERSGALGVRRGSITVRDRTILLALAGDAYGVPEAEYRRLFNGVSG